MATPASNAFVTSREAAAFLRLSPGTLANWRVLRKNLPYYKFGAGVRYRMKDLAQWALAGSREIDHSVTVNTRTDDSQLAAENSRNMRIHDA